MSGFGLLTPFESDEAIFSGGSWEAGLPLANLQDMQPTLPARSTDAETTSTVINIDATTSVAWDTLYLGRTNLSADAEITITADDVEANLDTAPTLTVGPVSAWPAGGRPTDRGLRWFDVFKRFTPGGSFRFWRIAIDDETNADERIQIGRAIPGTLWRPAYNYGPGINRTFNPADVRIETPYGHTLTSARLRPRVWQVPFPVMMTADAEDMAEEIMRLCGISDDLVVCLDLDATTKLHRQVMQATFQQASGLERIARDIWRITFTFKQVL